MEHALPHAAVRGDLRARHGVKFPLLVQGVQIGTYKADFVYLRDGIQVIEDAKGHRTKEFNRTAKHMAAMGLQVTIWPAK